MEAIEIYSDVMSKAVKANVLTNDDLATSPLCMEYWNAARKLAKAIVSMNFSKTSLVRTLNCWEYDDLVSEFTCVLIKKFQAQIKAMLNPKMDENGVVYAHNHNAYTTTIFCNFLNDSLKRYEVKKKKRVVDNNNKEHHISVNVTNKDANGNDVKVYWNNVYTSTPIKNDDTTLTIGDTLESDVYNPETMAIADSEELEAKQTSFMTLEKLCKMKTYLGSVYVFIEDKLIESGISCSLESILAIFKNIEEKSPAFQAAAKRSFVRAYNNDLVSFVDSVSENEISDEGVRVILTNYGKSFSDFGRDFHIDEDKIYHLRNEYKLAVAKINGVEVSKKFTKKSR